MFSWDERCIKTDCCFSGLDLPHDPTNYKQDQVNARLRDWAKEGTRVEDLHDDNVALVDIATPECSDFLCYTTVFTALGRTSLRTLEWSISVLLPRNGYDPYLGITQ